jgi:hypothetical protein
MSAVSFPLAAGADYMSRHKIGKVDSLDPR